MESIERHTTTDNETGRPRMMTDMEEVIVRLDALLRAAQDIETAIYKCDASEIRA